jgi:hypothetical protein
MGYFFLDVETFIDKENKSSGLNPYTSESKILAIAYNYYNEFKMNEKFIRPPTILKEWEEGEKEILNKFYNFIKIKLPDDKHFKFIGFNCIKFDLTYLLGRLEHHKIDSKEDIYENLFRLPHVIDLGQLAQIISNNRFKEIMNINQKEANKFFDIPVKKGSGKDVTIYYNNKEYEKILDYIKEEFTFETLYLKLKRHMFNKKNNEK